MHHGLMKGRLAKMIAVSICSFGFTAVAFAQSAPTYRPNLAWSAANGVAGRTLSGIEMQQGTAYSSDIPGPFGSAVTAKQTQTAGLLWFGGYPLKVSLREGADLWIRIYQFFPNDFCFSYGTAENDGWGATKWIRAQTTGGRSTIEMGTAGPLDDDRYGFKRWPTCGTVTAMYGDINEMGAGNRPFPNYTSAPIVRGRWQAIQVQWHFSSSGGFTRGWVDDVYLGQSNHTTLPSGAALEEIIYGDYWNGGAPKNQAFYFDEIVITTTAPNTLDSGGRPFIHPNTRVAHFSGVKTPNPPTNTSVQ